MKTYDKILPFMNRILYSYSNNNELWHQFENDLPRMHVYLNEYKVEDIDFLHKFLYSFFGENKLLTKYALACCTQAVMADAHAFLQKNLYHLVIGEYNEPKHMKIYITSCYDKLNFIVCKSLCSYTTKEKVIYSAAGYDVTIRFDICKSLQAMAHSKVETDVERVFITQ